MADCICVLSTREDEKKEEELNRLWFHDQRNGIFAKRDCLKSVNAATMAVEAKEKQKKKKINYRQQPAS